MASGEGGHQEFTAAHRAAGSAGLRGDVDTAGIAPGLYEQLMAVAAVMDMRRDPHLLSPVQRHRASCSTITKRLMVMGSSFLSGMWLSATRIYQTDIYAAFARSAVWKLVGRRSAALARELAAIEREIKARIEKHASAALHSLAWPP